MGSLTAKADENQGGASRFKNLLFQAVRFYTFNTPIPRGRHIIYLIALKLFGSIPSPRTVETKDKRKIWTDLSTGMHTQVYFLGEYEKFLTEITTLLLKKDDICLDVGANFGWYSTLFWKHIGEKGEAHSFEPMPPTFEHLQRNYDLMGKPENVFLNNFGLGDREDNLKINMFLDKTTGHASLSTQGRDDAVSYDCKIVTLDSYLKEKKIENVNFVKVDIEGAELMFLKGAENLFKQEIPPIWQMEMALQQTKSFGYLPDDLLKFMSERADYDFYKVDEIKNKLIKIEHFEKDDIGANVFCIPKGFYEDRRNLIKQYFA